MKSAPGMRVCLVVGDPSSPYCGVKDYALSLAGAMRARGVLAEVDAPRLWNTRAIAAFAAHLRARRFDVVHLQYPSLGHRGSLYPHALGWTPTGAATVVTLHEYSALPATQRASVHAFRLTARRLIFTTDFEQGVYDRRLGGLGAARAVVPIASSIPTHDGDPPRGMDVLYFGQIRPQKGIEQFLSLADLSRARGRTFRFAVIGSVPARQRHYYATLRARAGHAVGWHLDLPPSDVAERMARSLATYLPFPDGATFRRSSLIAAFANGLPVISPIGLATPRDLTDLVLVAEDVDGALAHVEDLCHVPGKAAAISRRVREAARDFSWTAITDAHLRIYAEVVDGYHA